MALAQHITVSDRPSADEASTLFRKLPQNIEAEQALLGALLVDNRAYEKVGEFLRPEHFFYPPHGKIYEAIVRLLEKGQIASPLTLKGYFESNTMLDDVGGAHYIAEIAQAAVSVVNIKHFGKAIFDAALRRELITLGEDVVNTSFAPEVGETAEELIEKAEQSLFDLATFGHYEGGALPFKALLIDALNVAELAYKREGSLMGLSTGITDLDRALGGLSPSDLVIIAGRPSMGKTVLATNISHNVAAHFDKTTPEDPGKKNPERQGVAFFSLEMSGEQLAVRLLSEVSGISSEHIRRGTINGDDFQKLVEASNRVSSLPLYIDDTPALTISALRTRARRLKRQHNISLIVVDYLQLLYSGGNRGHENKVQEITEITRGLKAIAKELNVPVIALSQLSRAVEQREDKRPQLSDLRESGSIEQDADVVMFLFREQYYLERAEPTQRVEETADKFEERYQRWAQRYAEVAETGEVIIAKHRHGPVGKVRLRYDPSTSQFQDLADDARLPYNV